MTCSDCGGYAQEMTQETLDAGSSIREPGEPLCGGCSSRRILMVRAVGRLPASLTDIRAKRASVQVA